MSEQPWIQILDLRPPGPHLHLSAYLLHPGPLMLDPQFVMSSQKLDDHGAFRPVETGQLFPSSAFDIPSRQ